jgi:hypothetical protein
MRGGWARREFELLQAHEQRTLAAERRRVKLIWWTVPPRGRRRADMLAPLARLWSGRPTDPGPTYVALYEAADPVGTRPFLVFRAEPGALPDTTGRAVATLVGEAVAGGTLLVELHRHVVSPLEPPVEPDEDAPPWSEVDSDA